MLAKLLAILRNVDPQQVKQILSFIAELVATFQTQSGQGQPFGATAGDESLKKAREELVEHCRSVGCDETEAAAVAAQLPS